MCGRYQLNLSSAVIHDFFGIEAMPRIEPRWNIAPSQEVLTIRDDPEMSSANSGTRKTVQRIGQPVRWGLIPFWAKDTKIGYKMINARAESAPRKPAFRAALRYRRCLVPASGFYEWRKQAESKVKQPFLFTRRDKAPIAFAGLWETWEDKEQGIVIESATILTTEANEDMAPIHDRMPVILETESFDRWLDPTLNGKAGEVTKLAEALLKPPPANTLTRVPVSTEVNSPKNDRPEVARSVEQQTFRLDESD